jgi:hypothetical protein
LTAKLLFIIALLLSFALLTTASAAYTPHLGDHFSFYEVENLRNGTGNYSGYTEQTIVNGTEIITGVSGSIVSTNYSLLWTWSNNTGGTNSGSVSGSFTFSSITFLYINGTDDQTGYVNPHVWFCLNNSILNGGSFYLLNTEMTVMSKDYSYFLPSENKNVETIFTQGSSSYQRDDVYGQFNATYTWNTYFDPSSGYIVGYNYIEQDTNASGNGFTFTDNLYINSASYSLTAVPSVAPVASNIGLYVLLILIIVIIAVIVIVARRRKRPTQQQTIPPSEAPPKGPASKCPYCGGPIYFGDKDITNCEYCGREVQKPPSDS